VEVNVRSCVGFPTPATTNAPRTQVAAVGKAPRHEVAGSLAEAVQLSCRPIGSRPRAAGWSAATSCHGPSANFLANAKRSLVTGVMRTRFAYVVFFA
jgi:hypothetical protein